MTETLQVSLAHVLTLCGLLISEPRSDLVPGAVKQAALGAAVVAAILRIAGTGEIAAAHGVAAIGATARIAGLFAAAKIVAGEVAVAGILARLAPGAVAAFVTILTGHCIPPSGLRAAVVPVGIEVLLVAAVAFKLFGLAGPVVARTWLVSVA